MFCPGEQGTAAERLQKGGAMYLQERNNVVIHHSDRKLNYFLGTLARRRCGCRVAGCHTSDSHAFSTIHHGCCVG